MTLPLVLASTSPFRREVLSKLGLPFETASPDVDESALTGESPEMLVARLSEAKARAVAGLHPEALIIGSDQVAVLATDAGVEVLGKPGDHPRAALQLRRLSGHRVTFLTGLCLYNSAADRAQGVVEPFHVHFRELSEDMIERYLQAEQPYNCAGSFKSEALGIVLFDRLEGDDPNALIGLPLIRLVRLLEEEDVHVL
ncbi:Maf family protein [Endothiovibrio diazotrophicus]